jgi:hypothetical protein
MIKGWMIIIGSCKMLHVTCAPTLPREHTLCIHACTEVRVGAFGEADDGAQLLLRLRGCAVQLLRARVRDHAQPFCALFAQHALAAGLQQVLLHWSCSTAAAFALALLHVFCRLLHGVCHLSRNLSDSLHYCSKQGKASMCCMPAAPMLLCARACMHALTHAAQTQTATRE